MGKFDDLTLEDLPEIAARLGEMKYEASNDDTLFDFQQTVLAFLAATDKAMCSWEFTARHYLMLQDEFAALEKVEAESWGHQTTQGFLTVLTHLDDLGPEGETARAHFSKFSSIAEMARNFVITEEG